MDVDHPHFRQIRRPGDRAGNRVGNVVELEIEEYLKTEVRELFDRSRAFSCEELKPYFEEACCAAEPPRQGAGRPQAVNIQRYD